MIDGNRIDSFAENFRNVMRRHSAGVTIITTMSAEGPVGFTASSFTAVSLRPPLISFNIANNSSSIAAIRKAGRVAVHVLGAHQETLARRFSGAAADRFADRSSWRIAETGEPVLEDSPIVLHADVARLIPVGDHFIAVGLVRRVVADAAEDFDPLTYHNGNYHRPHLLPVRK
ncbi:flavin reductase family protein [Nocardia sp. IFM 10818]